MGHGGRPGVASFEGPSEELLRLQGGHQLRAEANGHAIFHQMDNLDGYGVSAVNHDWGSDIQSVASSFGGGAICLFENPQQPDAVSMPRFTPTKNALAPKSLWNTGQISDTRYAYEVIVNGPIRSIIKIKGMNWNSGNGSYEYEQYYTVFAKQSYTTSRVEFTDFSPAVAGVKMGVGIRKKPDENFFVQEDGIIISSGPESIKNPENIDDREEHRVEFVGTALVIKDAYEPEYQFVSDRKGNHTFRITNSKQNAFEYMLSSAWSEGAVYNNKNDFSKYIRKTSLEYNSPVDSKFIRIQYKSTGR